MDSHPIVSVEYPGSIGSLGTRARALWTRVVGAWRMLRMLLQGGNLAVSYAFLAHLRRHMFEPAIGMQRAILQGVWDRYPGVAPTRRELELLLEHDPPRPGDTVLDVGCGEGALIELLATRCPDLAALTAVDALPSHLAAVQDLLAWQPEHFRRKVRLVQGLAQQLPPGALGKDVDRAYLVELTQDLGREEFERIFAAVFAALRPGGLMALAVLAANRTPASFLEKVIFDVVVRPGSPSQQDLRSLFSRYPCDVVEVDVTRDSSQAASEYFLSHPQLVDRALLWPFNRLFNLSVRAGMQVIASGGYVVRLVHVRKWEEQP